MAINSGNNSPAHNPQSPPPPPPTSGMNIPPTDPIARNPQSLPPPSSGENIPPTNPIGQTDATPPVPRSREGIRMGEGSYNLQPNVPCLDTNLRKRAREGGDSGAGPSLPPQQRPVPAAAAFVCAEKSLAGHMRMHPDREWRGMFPPPVFTRDDFADVIELPNQPEEEEEEENGEAGYGGAGEDAGRRRFNLPDLNKTP